MMTARSWVIIAGVGLHGRTPAMPTAIQATPIATIASNAMNPAAFDAYRPARRQVDQVHRDHHEQSGRLEALRRRPASSRFGAPSAERIPIVSLPFGHR